MVKAVVSIALLSAMLAASTSASPAPLTPRNLVKRYTDGVDCDDDGVNTTVGELIVTDGENSVYCSDINTSLVTAEDADGVHCFRATENDDHQIVKCPGDPAPKKNPDGSDAEVITDGFIDTWCNAAMGGPAPIEFGTMVGCLLFGYYEANGNPIAQEESGAMAVCDTIFAGACTFFTDVAPEIAAGMDRACVDDPNSNACSFANPGKK